MSPRYLPDRDETDIADEMSAQEGVEWDGWLAHRKGELYREACEDRAALLAEVERLRPPQGHSGVTHWEGCWESRGHHDCAVAEIQRLRAQPSHQQQPGWLPIESAPKDGTHVLLTDGEMISCGYWCGSQHAPRWMSDSGEPTHWQPLPEPPANA